MCQAQARQCRVCPSCSHQPQYSTRFNQEKMTTCSTFSTESRLKVVSTSFLCSILGFEGVLLIAGILRTNDPTTILGSHPFLDIEIRLEPCFRRVSCLFTKNTERKAHFFFSTFSGLHLPFKFQEGPYSSHLNKRRN